MKTAITGLEFCRDGVNPPPKKINHNNNNINMLYDDNRCREFWHKFSPTIICLGATTYVGASALYLNKLESLESPQYNDSAQIKPTILMTCFKTPFFNRHISFDKNCVPALVICCSFRVSAIICFIALGISTSRHKATAIVNAW